MDEVAGFLCVVVIVLAFITLLGHGIWVVLAAILRWLSGAGSVSQKAARPCPACGTSTRA